VIRGLEGIEISLVPVQSLTEEGQTLGDFNDRLRCDDVRVGRAHNYPERLTLILHAVPVGPTLSQVDHTGCLELSMLAIPCQLSGDYGNPNYWM
jgi:hypothetical protein